MVNYREKIVGTVDGVQYDPDASPKAWEHYAQVYKNHFRLYDSFDFKAVRFATYRNFNYYNEPQKGIPNRKFAFIKEGVDLGLDMPFFRLGGETDFNFNCGQLKKYRNKTKDASVLEKLERCGALHHTVLNFSVMFASGNMQVVKKQGYGDRLDRLDSFISLLNDYYSTDGQCDTILKRARKNKGALSRYLALYKDIYDYCEQIYFISDTKFVDALISSGKKPIKTSLDLDSYMDLAMHYWAMKEQYFLHQSI